MKHEREDLLRRLESVSPGLAVKEAVEQSSCFVFKGGRVITFNDEIACSIACDMQMEGAVSAKPLVELLGKMVESDIDITPSEKEGEIIVKGKRRRAGITLEAEITLPVGTVEPPTKWNPVDPEFAEAVSVVQQCASKDRNVINLTCIHVTPDWVEACDNLQLARYPVATGLSEPCLVKRDSLKHVIGLGMTEVAETETWIHFRNPAGLSYRDLSPVLDTEGTPTTLPGGLAEAVEKAEIFSGENADNNVVIVELKKGQLRLKGIGASGWYEERKTVKWDDDPLAFSIAPKLLADITTRANDCYITHNRLKIDGGKFVYVTALGKAG